MKEIVLTEAEIKQICVDIGSKLTQELKDEEKLPVFIGTMKGAMNFFMDLIKEVKLYMYTDYIQISSYSGTGSTGVINFKRGIELDVKDRVVVLVEDVIDTGCSMAYLINYLNTMLKPKRVIIVSLFDKPSSHQYDIKVDYVGRVLTESKFLMGYGLDYNEIDRNVPFVYVPDDSQIEEWNDIIKNR